MQYSAVGARQTSMLNSKLRIEQGILSSNTLGNIK